MSDTDSEQSGKEIYVHPIQLQFVAVRELFIKTYRPLSPDFVVPDEEVQIDSLFSGYHAETKTAQIHARVCIGDPHDLTGEQEEALANQGASLRMKVHLVGQYSIGDKFPLNMLDEWAAKGGAMVLFPYVREHVYSLTARCGIRPVILPVMQMPTIKMAEPTFAQQSAAAD